MTGTQVFLFAIIVAGFVGGCAGGPIGCWLAQALLDALEVRRENRERQAFTEDGDDFKKEEL